MELMNEQNIVQNGKNVQTKCVAKRILQNNKAKWELQNKRRKQNKKVCGTVNGRMYSIRRTMPIMTKRDHFKRLVRQYNVKMVHTYWANEIYST